MHDNMRKVWGNKKAEIKMKLCQDAGKRTVFIVLKLDSSLEREHMIYDGVSFTCAPGQRFTKLVLLCLKQSTSSARLCNSNVQETFFSFFFFFW